MAKNKHIHQYTRIYPHGRPGNKYIKDTGVWACALPDCTHFMPHNVAGQVVGKMSLCNECMEVFVLDEDNMKEDKPVCTACSSNIVISEDFDMERHEARSLIATKRGKELGREVMLSEVTEEEVDKMVMFLRLRDNG